MAQSSPPMTPARILLIGISLVYLILGFGWLVYGFFTETGIPGYLMYLQMQYLNGSRRDMTMMGILLVVAVGVAPVFWLLHRLNVREGYTPQLPAKAAGSLSLPQRMGFAAFFVVCSVIIFLVRNYQTQELTAASLVRIELDRQPAIAPQTRLALVSGVVETTLGQVILEKQSNGVDQHTWFVPLTPTNWQPGQPIQVVLKTLGGVYYDSLAQRAILFSTNSPFPASFDGELTANSLPGYVAESFQKQSLTLASPYYVLDDQAAYQGQALVEQRTSNNWYILGIGVFIGLVMLFSPNKATRQ